VAIMHKNVAGTTLEPYSTENRGKPVKAVAYGGKVIERLVWEELGDVVYLCTQRCFDQLAEMDPIGWTGIGTW
jgi:hypothetical protein